MSYAYVPPLHPGILIAGTYAIRLLEESRPLRYAAAIGWDGTY